MRIIIDIQEYDTEYDFPLDGMEGILYFSHASKLIYIFENDQYINIDNVPLLIPFM